MLLTKMFLRKLQCGEDPLHHIVVHKISTGDFCFCLFYISIIFQFVRAMRQIADSFPAVYRLLLIAYGSFGKLEAQYRADRVTKYSNTGLRISRFYFIRVNRAISHVRKLNWPRECDGKLILRRRYFTRVLK